MIRSTPVLILAVGLLLVLAANVLFIVPQTQQAIVLQFGAVQEVINGGKGTPGPGLHVKAPMIQNVVTFDNRNLGFNLQEERIIAADQEQLLVDAFVRWRIADPVRFYEQAPRSEDAGVQRLRSVLATSLRRVLGRANRVDIITTRRAELTQQVRQEVAAAATAIGVQIIDVRIRQADLVPDVLERAFERMRTERNQVAQRLRAEGDEQATRIRAEADRAVTVTLATAREQAEKTRGAGDAERARIFAAAYGRDAEFAAFYRSMIAYERALPAGTQMIMPPNGEFFRYLRNKDGGR